MTTSADGEQQATEYVLRFTVPAEMTEDFAPAFGQLIGVIEPLMGAIVDRGGDVRITMNGNDITDVL
ncbi:hypothetical protein BJY24_004956 [Nocardia transvalensis]|uniref:Uncharacterized protein n=1 Tax=Nocardia transvalensis TaxID=37333 RepID=A0A7W9PH57_9NOCA|nr:hypothetical protein [Nocardia transvalensis]MBB5916044.1 hypothetical protein [Nocardia transvalensis]